MDLTSGDIDLRYCCILFLSKYFNELRFLKMDETRTTNQVEEVNKQLKEIPKEAEERRIENQPQTGKNEKAIEPF